MHIEQYLKKVVSKHKIPDVYFFIHMYGDLKIEGSFPLCRQLPLFMFNKNTFFINEKDKFLLPDEYVLVETWRNDIE